MGNALREYETLCQDLQADYEVAARESREALDRIKREMDTLPRTPGLFGRITKLIAHLQILHQQAEGHRLGMLERRVEAEKQVTSRAHLSAADFAALNTAAERYHLAEMARIRLRRQMAKEVSELLRQLAEDRTLLLLLAQVEPGGDTQH